MTVSEQEPQGTTSHEYLTAFTGSLNRLANKINRSVPHSFVPLVNNSFGKFLYIENGLVMQDGTDDLGKFITDIEVPVELFISPAESPDDEIRLVHYRSVLIPRYFKGRNIEHEVRLYKYIATLNAVPSGGSFVGPEGSDDLMYQTEGRFRDVTVQHLQWQIFTHATALTIWKEHLDGVKNFLAITQSPDMLSENLLSYTSFHL
jgi:hypothetical protein